MKWIALRDKKKETASDSDRKAKEGQKVAQLFRGNLMDAIVAAHAPEVKRSLLLDFVRSSWKRLDRDSQRRISKAMGMEPEVKEEGFNAGYKDYSVVLEPWLDSMGDEFLAPLMLRMMAAYELSVSEHQTSGHYQVPPILGGMAQRLDVDALELLEEVQEKLKPTKLVNLL